jgi:hypothetical protein
MIHGNVLKSILSVLIITLFLTCSQERAVKEHFQTHGLFYPVDSSGVSLLNVEYINFERDELSAPGAREFVEEGVLFTKEFFVRNKIHNYISGSTAVVLSKPVLFKDETGTVGFMIEVTAFGGTMPSDTVHEKEQSLPVGVWRNGV